MMHAYTGNCLGMRSILLRDYLVIFHGHRRVIQALEYAAHLREDRNIVREMFKASLTCIQSSHWLIEPDIDSDQSQDRFDVFMILQRRLELLLCISYQS